MFYRKLEPGETMHHPDFKPPKKGDTSSTEYKLVWSDEFNKDGRPDPCNWTYEIGFVRNRELQWNQPENARCENGLLIIEGRREAMGG